MAQFFLCRSVVKCPEIGRKLDHELRCILEDITRQVVAYTLQVVWEALEGGMAIR